MLVDVSDYPADGVYRNAADESFSSAGQVRVKHTGAGAFTVDFGYDRFGLISFCPRVAVGTIAQSGFSAINVVPATEGGGSPILNSNCVYNVTTVGDLDFNLVQADPSTSGFIIGP